MLMLDSNSGHVVGSVPIGTGVDANAFDNQLQLAFSSNGEGTLSVIQQEGADDPAQAVVLRQTVAQIAPATLERYLREYDDEVSRSCLRG